MQKQRVLVFVIVLLLLGSIALLIKTPLRLGLDLQGGAQLTIQVKTTEKGQTVQSGDLNAVKKVLENRVNGLGVSEAFVQTAGDDKIIVQLPGVTDAEQAERILGGTAQLEFREQMAGTEAQLAIELQILAQKRAEVELARQSGDKAKLIQAQQALQESNQALAKLFKPATIMGKNLTDAVPVPLQNNNGWEVSIRFDDKGGTDFAELTKNIAGTGRSLGIFLDNNLLSAPVVGPEFATTGISGGGATITGNFTIESARDLAVQIKGGSLPFPVEVVENRTVGATLGQDSIKRSIYAGVAGLFLVLIFMGVYYRVPGIIADISLIIYAILNLACFALLGVTLTLPGIAGFILSIGMAVDANVLIFERTREELRAGKTLYRSVESGFYRAFSSILDSNVTTLIACGALFWFGSGLVKGFALTLAIGVGISMFTALTCSRTFLLITVLGIPSLKQKPQLFCPNVSPAITVQPKP